MTLTRLLPGPATAFDLEDAEGQAALDELYRPPRARWLRLNFIASVNGSVTGPDGTSQSLTNRTDRRILGAIRRSADVVLVGAGSVRTEGYLLPRSRPLAIMTGSGDLRGHRIPTDVENGRVIVLCPSDAVETVRSSLGEARVTIIDVAERRTGGPGVAPAAALAALHRLGHESIVCEGGPSLAIQLIAADLVDELCLSTSPQLVALGQPLSSGLDHPRHLALTQLLLDGESTLYARWTVRD
ncbi:dihydrofolate reductase family protein [Leifsonia bigeumensis]|uniref:Dihydrofolate reductase family protein n=1 Tax=Leifsonella bigeumensis TaxID=433643 RepID=A0ABP7FWE8_9MICO